MNKKQWFILIGGFWLIILGGFIFIKEFTVQTGNEVLLRTVPVDPHDLFRGDYVILRYDISRIKNITLYNNATNIRKGDTVYVMIKPNLTNIAQLINVTKMLPKDQLFIKGKVTNKTSKEIFIEYGIESYFVPEGEGYEIEKNMGDIYARVIIDKYGNAILKSLILNGKEIKNR